MSLCASPAAPTDCRPPGPSSSSWSDDDDDDDDDLHLHQGLGEETSVPLNDTPAAVPGSAFATTATATATAPRMNRVGSCAAVVGGAGGDVTVGRTDSYALFRGSDREGRDGEGREGIGGAAAAVRAMGLDGDGDGDDDCDDFGNGGAAKLKRTHGSDYVLSSDGRTSEPAPPPVGCHGGDVQVGRSDSYSLFRGDSCGPDAFGEAAEESRRLERERGRGGGGGEEEEEEGGGAEEEKKTDKEEEAQGSPIMF